jgi:hypothetical protein
MSRRFCKLHFVNLKLSEKCSKSFLSVAFLTFFILVLLLAFLAQIALANNKAIEIRSFVVGGLICEVATSCQGGWIDMLHLSNETNAHAELSNNSDYPYKVCCVSNESGVNWINNTCEQKYWIMLHLSNETNAHAELNNNSEYSINLCMSVNSTSHVINWSYRTNCSSYGGCIVSISNDTNAHLANCESGTAYATKLCADIILDETNPIVTLLSPANNTNATSTEIEFNYTVDDDNYIASCSLIVNGTTVNTSTSITKQINQTFIQTLAYGSFNWSISCTDANSNTGTSSTRKLAIKGMDCEVATSCQSGYYDLLHMNNTYDAHAELSNRSNFNYKVCCKSNVPSMITANCSSDFGNYWIMLHLYQETNSHVELNNRSNFNINACINLNSTTYVFNCNYKSSCGNAETCLASVNQETNSHIADCNAGTAYGIRLCCSIEEDTKMPIINLTSPVNGSTWDGQSSSTVTFSYNVSDANNIVNCSLYIDGSRDQTDSTITKDTTQTFLKEFTTSGNHTWYVECTDAANNIGSVPSWQFNFSTISGEAPDIAFMPPTPDDGVRQIKNWIFINVSVNTTTNDVDTCLLEWNDGSSPWYPLKCSSSKLFKENIQDYTLNISNLVALSPKIYTRKSSNVTEVGLLAEDVAEVLPEFVVYDFYNSTSTEKIPFDVRYRNLAAVSSIELAKKVKTQEQQITYFSTIVQELKTENNAQQQQIEQLKAIICLEHPLAELCQ